MTIKNNPILNRKINPIGNSGSIPAQRQQTPVQGNFGSILQQKLNPVTPETKQEIKFSKHAEMRLQARNIRLSDAQLDRLKNAVGRAAEKGVKDSLVLVDNIAMVVNIPSKTVITAVNSSEMKENVFTNIDGAVVG